MKQETKKLSWQEKFIYFMPRFSVGQWLFTIAVIITIIGLAILLGSFLISATIPPFVWIVVKILFIAICLALLVLGIFFSYVLFQVLKKPEILKELKNEARDIYGCLKFTFHNAFCN